MFGSRATLGLTEQQTSRAIAAWREHDAAHVLHTRDRAALGSADALRALVLAELAADRPARDLYSACARLGRSLAESSVSPSLAVATLDGAAAALEHLGVPWDRARLAPARASAAEGYVAAVLEAERLRARVAWEYPACAVRITQETVAFVAAPHDDPEVTADWAARVALAASRDGYANAVVSGYEPAATELREALASLGITLAPATSASAAAGDADPLPWHARLSSLFRGSRGS